MKIKTILTRQILDSRGNPTIEVDVITTSGALGRAAVPSGASTGEHEALELRDNGPTYHGQGVQRAIDNILQKISPALIGQNADDQSRIDELMIEMDGTNNKSSLGANAILGVSLAVAHVAAVEKQMPLYRHLGELHGNSVFTLPRPMVNIINGGQHAPGATEIQEFMIFPKLTDDFALTIQQSSEVFMELKKILKSKNLSTTVGDEGGFVPGLSSSTEVLDLIMQAVEQAGYQPGDDIELAVDVAASEFYSNNAYQLTTTPTALNSSEMIAWLQQLGKDYPLVSVEDGLDQNDWDSWCELTTRLGQSTQIVGDDLLVTNPDRLQKAIDTLACNAILIKLNQIGTLTETLRTIKLAQANNIRTIISHRSGETEDTTIAHLAVGTNAGQIKTGSVSRGERTAKYNELLRISELLSKT